MQVTTTTVNNTHAVVIAGLPVVQTRINRHGRAVRFTV